MNDERRSAKNAAPPSIITADVSKAVGPRLIIEMIVEEQRRVRQAALNAKQSRWLEFWIQSQPHLHELVHDAMRLSRDAA